MARRLIPPNHPIMPRPITGPMPNGDAQDPPVDRIALSAARDIHGILNEPSREQPEQRIARVQIILQRAINEALDRCQALGGRRAR